MVEGGNDNLFEALPLYHLNTSIVYYPILSYNITTAGVMCRLQMATLSPKLLVLNPQPNQKQQRRSNIVCFADHHSPFCILSINLAFCKIQLHIILLTYCFWRSQSHYKIAASICNYCSFYPIGSNSPRKDCLVPTLKIWFENLKLTLSFAWTDLSVLKFFDLPCNCHKCLQEHGKSYLCKFLPSSQSGGHPL